MTTTIPAAWRVSDGTVPVSDVARTAQTYGVSYESVSYAVRTGALPVAKVGGQGGARHLSVEDALLVLAVSALAVAAGIAFGHMLKAVRETGAKVTPTGVTIPLPQAA